ncbi:MAG: type II secretion system protein [Nanoarchaeota archaeon]|nr:type II secretion system protein [Nanoarchaeota archaeon]
MHKHTLCSLTKSGAGFTMLELLLALGIISFLMASIIVVFRPNVWFAGARNNKRTSDTHALLNAIATRRADNKGIFSCVSGEFPSARTRMSSGMGGYNIVPCLYPAYLPGVPRDPNGVGVYYTSTSSYDLGYEVWQDSVTGRVTVGAPFAELGEVISAVR